ncbi:hypothetical protein AYO40_05750 [Planctomycetaceae bacterium SCGC AG-212-D15]|nr:hypothetical protein AYO40_05750 [Planctomycetaceae bacterium SCGC AG-212-D15]
MKRVLLTSFEPFGKHRRNSSLEIGEAVAAAPPAGIALQWLILPVVAKRCVDMAWECIERLRPSLVLALGQSDRAAHLQIERVALNVNDFAIADNAGQRPRDAKIAADGPAAYFTTIPARAVVSGLLRRKIPARLSYSAGTYVCNHLLYGLLHRTAQEGRRMRVGFVHLPLVPGQGKRPTRAPSRAKMIEGVRFALAKCVETRAPVHSLHG